MFNVANMHFWGWHVPQDYQKAYQYFAKLNELGVEGTNYYLGLYAENGYLYATGSPGLPVVCR